MKNSKDYMSLWGIGPFYVASILVITISGWIIGSSGMIDFACIVSLDMPMCVSGVLLILFSVAFSLQYYAYRIRYGNCLTHV